MMMGREPSLLLDHANGNELNNRWLNLRDATGGQNIQNAKLRRDNISGVKGVSWDCCRNKWRAIISLNRQHYRLGYFNSITAAARVVERKRLELHGAFARHH
jgi:AP2 domain